ncbi:amidase/aspartyl-tRNA(Asn)/glutamyl-tRNA(Gln) amidotransferase subunit A [Mesobacillus persicus]|uniref:Amidase/aspartyl-tRNA(Asn)/glutamyl-tRNA(Gln) amidotransferase subunit A n=1 Tax=Mesobacillus persicus TaxID=930146 RepID=A0A1H7WLH6_9BACI|nr:amidase family protein [Mesobacillus persicus]SEM21737.1 amidase/aspartyl-tRNA(Asn)/glutamyl-tRNA(Gln) amidotransferase subunit A [Mesobacillus persicus]
MEDRTLLKTVIDDFPLKEVTVKELMTGYEEGRFTSEAVVQSYLNRIEIYEKNYNAFTFMNTNALEEAREIDRLRSEGKTLGPLAGVPIVIKEAVDVEGFPSTFGWAPLCKETGGIELLPKKDASIVTRLKESGAIILGKTNMPAFSARMDSANTSWDGPTYNAVDRGFSPGGSSSGTATAVSGNFTVLGIAEETGGSIQMPAASQAIVGIKTSFGLVPTKGVTPLGGSTRDVLGTHARTVEDAALMLDIIAGYDEDDPKTKDSIGKMPDGGYTSELSEKALQGKRLGVFGPGWSSKVLSEETNELYSREINELKQLGAEVVADPFSGSGFVEYVESLGNDLARMILGLDSVFFDIENYLKNLDPQDDTISMRKVFERAGEFPWSENGPLNLVHFFANPEEAMANCDHYDLTYFNEVRNNFLNLIQGVMDKYGLDGFVFPQMVQSITLLEEGTGLEGIATTVSEVNISGLPLVTVPAGYYQNGSPFALVFMGEMWSEAKLLGFSYAYEQATKHRVAPVLIR